MDNNLEDQLIRELESLIVTTPPQQKSIEYRVYYGDDGKVITYTTETLPGNYIIISREQWVEARHDALVIAGKLVYTHTKRNVIKLEHGDTGRRAARWDVNILSNDEYTPYFYWSLVSYDIQK